ncbi:CRISPR-associated protein [bacterium]|nr:CRISPR-associated protein [bacterium]MBU1956914.1 CRISPR-associated protein [bacterium]
MTLHYEIKFLDYWHMSSGLSAGAKLDSTVTKDTKGIPYVSGKTLKGLAREMAEILGDKAFVKKCFGAEEIDMGECYFSNVELSKETREEIIEYGLQERLYDVIASTKIGKKDKFKDGKQIEKRDIAVDNSLREIEVVVPITLEGVIDDIPDEYQEKMKQSLKMIKRMGLNRNRGLGRCEISIVEGK